MYKFSNGVVVFTEEDKENFLRAGYVLVEEEKHENDNSDRNVEEKFERWKKTNPKV